MNTRLAVSLALVAVLGASWFLGAEPRRTSLGAVPRALEVERDGDRREAPRRASVRGARRIVSEGRGAATTPSTGGAPEPERGDVVFRVHDRAGRPVAGSEWRLVASRSDVRLDTMLRRPWFRGRAGMLARADLFGHVWFRDLPAGRWVLVAQLDGVSAPLLPVRAEANAVVVVAGRTTSVELEVERAATLHGVVRHADGRSEVAWLRATTSSPGGRHMADTVDALTDEDGTFRMFARPGRVRLETQALPAGEVLSDVVRPDPAIVHMAAGSSHRFELVYGAGHTTVVGRVVDQDGAPWVGLEATLRASWTDSTGASSPFGWTIGRSIVDDSGTFRFEHVPAGSHSVTFGHPGSDFPGPGGIAEYPVGAAFECPVAGTVDVGTSLVHRWTNVLVEGAVITGADQDPRNLTLTVELPPWNRITRRASTKPIQRRARIDFDGRFTLDYSAHVPGELTFVLVGDEGERRTVVPFDVGEGRYRAVTLTYP